MKHAFHWASLCALIAFLCALGSPETNAASLTAKKGYGYAVSQNGCIDAGGGYAYVGCAGALVIFNVSTGSEVARINLDGKIEDVELDGTDLYVAARNKGLLIYDVSTPASPSLSDSWGPPTGKVIRSVAVKGGYAYLKSANQDSIQLLTIRLSDMTQTGTYTPSTSFYGGVEATDSAVLFGSYDTGQSFDVRLGVMDRRTNPQAPTYSTVVNTTGRINNMHAAPGSDYVYLALGNGYDGITVFDVSNPNSPSNKGYASGVTYGGKDVCLDGGYAFLGTGGNRDQGEVACYSISSGVPTYVSKKTTAAISIGSVGATSNHLMTSGANNVVPDEARCYNVSNKSNMTLDWTQDVPAWCEGAYVVGDYLYGAMGHDGLWILDITDPDDVEFVAEDDSGFWSGVGVFNSHGHFDNFDVD